MRGKIIGAIALFFILSCHPDTVFSSYTSPGEAWEKEAKIHFVFQAKDTITRYNVFIMVRNNENYRFGNLFLIATMRFPDGQTVTDTLEYAMAKPDGEWLGKGFTAVKESKLWYKEHMRFPVPGDYHFYLEHAMRKNGAVDGLMQLQGITDVGIKINTTDE
ncbi:MAG: gliding motility lipoprotein GldH [Sinomicrobium sp.]|nr:gliding motility lipoprotein GldH [Sinomicrobium sp.]